MKKDFINDYVKIPVLGTITLGLLYAGLCIAYGQNPVDVTKKVSGSVRDYVTGVQTNILPKDKAKALETITSDEYLKKISDESTKPIEP